MHTESIPFLGVPQQLMAKASGFKEANSWEQIYHHHL